MNLLLTLLYGDVRMLNNNALSGCSIDLVDNITELVSGISSFETLRSVASALSTPQSPTTQLLSWLSSNSVVLAPAPEETKIPGFKDSVFQFFGHGQNESVHNAVETPMKKASG